MDGAPRRAAADPADAPAPAAAAAAAEPDPAEALRLFFKICHAVNAAHLRGIVHRDLKPGNVSSARAASRTCSTSAAPAPG